MKKVRQDNSLRIINRVGVFASISAVTAAAIYFYSPTFLSSASETIDVGIDVSSVLSMSVSDDTPSGSAPAGGGLAELSTIASVITNSRFGWSLSLEDADSNTSMTSETSEDVITSEFYSYKTAETFDDNTWGFSVGEGKYYAIPEYGSPIKISSSNVPAENAADTTLTFGIYVGTYLTSGHYADQVLLTAYANGVDGEPGDGTELDVISDVNLYGTMQGFKCNRDLPNIGDYKSLMDVRDNNIYKVARLADDKCWMVSNLAIINKELTSQYSDVARGTTFTVPAGGDWLWPYQIDDNAAVLDTNSTRYGGYYTWYTATAGEGTRTTINQNVQHSICPKGWRLPTGGENSEVTALFNAYSWNLSQLGGLPNINAYDRGYLNPTSGNNTPKQFAAWTATSYAETTALIIYTNPPAVANNISATMTKSKATGVTVRCIARS